MNYFELHLGDYEAATAHLTVLEDGIYGRLLRLYYRTEKPIPADIKQACRLVRATSKPERDAVQQVLSDFFELREDGYHQQRCDEEIERYQAGEPEREAKKANEDNRLKRYREERAALFKVLNEAGEHLPWNVSMVDLRAAATRISNGGSVSGQPLPETLQVTAPATPATATQTPSTRHQSPERVETRRGSRLPADWRMSPEQEAYCREHRPDLVPLKTAERFRDYWVAKAGKDAVKLDWDATWRNWVRNEKALQAVAGRQSADIFG